VSADIIKLTLSPIRRDSVLQDKRGRESHRRADVCGRWGGEAEDMI